MNKRREILLDTNKISLLLFSQTLHFSIAAFSILFAYPLLKTLRMSFFAQECSMMLLPWVQSTTYILGLLFSLSLISRKKFFYVSTILLIITVFLYINNYSLIGFGSFLFLNLLASSSLLLFWTSAHSHHSHEQSKKVYPLFIFLGQIGSYLGALCTPFILHYFSLLTLICIAVFFLWIGGICLIPYYSFPSLSWEPSKFFSFSKINKPIIQICVLAFVCEGLHRLCEIFFLIQISQNATHQFAWYFSYTNALVQGGALLFIVGMYWMKKKYNSSALVITPFLFLLMYGSFSSSLTLSLFVFSNAWYLGMYYPAFKIAISRMPTHDQKNVETILSYTLRPLIALTTLLLSFFL